MNAINRREVLKALGGAPLAGVYLNTLNAGPTNTATDVSRSLLFQLALIPPLRFESFIAKK